MVSKQCKVVEVGGTTAKRLVLLLRSVVRLEGQLASNGKRQCRGRCRHGAKLCQSFVKGLPSQIFVGDVLLPVLAVKLVKGLPSQIFVGDVLLPVLGRI